MNIYKRAFALLLAALVLLSLAACNGRNENVLLSGTLELENTGGYIDHINDVHLTSADQKKVERKNYSNISSALLDLENGKIDFFSCGKTTADYVVAQSNKFTTTPQNAKANYSMMTMGGSTEIYNILDTAIKALKADGTLETLVENDLKAYIESDPTPKDLPHFDGAITIKVGVTGDLSPMDYVSANGKAAGFNVALLTAIANRAKVNFTLVHIDSSARPMALSTGKVDVIFWAKSVTCLACNESFKEDMGNTLLTESYYSDTNVRIEMKTEN